MMEDDDRPNRYPTEQCSKGNYQDVSQLENYKERELELLKVQKEKEIEFGQKRAQFREIFLQKEGELKKMTESYNTLQQQKADNDEEMKKLKDEIDELKTAVFIAESSKQDEIDLMQRKCQEEVASLQHIMKEAVAQASQSAAEKEEEERIKLIQAKETLEEEVQNLRSKLSQEREGFLSSVAKSLKKVSREHLGGSSSEAENLEDSMRRAQEDADMLRSVIMPLEEEIQALKDKLRSTDAKLQVYEAQEKQKVQKQGEVQTYAAEDMDRSYLSKSDENLGEKVKELNSYLEAEKSSRTDLEMYVAVLNTQKTVLQDDADKLRAELHEVCRILEQEKREHNDLKRTWQMANDQFLESQRLMMMDMRRMESVITAEQSRQLTELQKKDHEREAQEQRVKELELMREREQEQQEKRRLYSQYSPLKESPHYTPTNLFKTDAASKTSLNSIKSDDIRLDDPITDDVLGIRRTLSSSQISNASLDFTDNFNESSSLHDTTESSRVSPDKNIRIPSLTEAQQKAITDPTPEVEKSKSILAMARAKNEELSMVGKRLVSEKEWEMLQLEVKAAREKLGRPCDMCNNYEAQLQTLQQDFKSVRDKTRVLERQVEHEKQSLNNIQQYCTELEECLRTAAEDAQKQISSLITKVQESEKYMVEVRQQFTQSQTDLQSSLKTLTENREDVHKEMKKLQEENDSLVGKYSKHSQQMQEESINLPNNLEEMQLCLLNYREEIIKAKVAREHQEDSMHSEMMFLKDQVLSEQQEKITMEETLTQELSQLQQQLANLQSVKSELERQKSIRIEAENKLKEVEASLKSIQSKSKQLISALQNQVEEQTNTSNKLEAEQAHLKTKIMSLQVELDNSEAVQRDFVKLSQSLQIQLEKIRQAENEVRWQHEEDVEDCNNCKQPFSVTRRKHHCKHCGKIFCMECLTKVVNSGPNLRPSKVCDVCHTILVKDATPFFSTEPPISPM